MIAFGVVLCLLVLLVIVSPFFLGPGGALAVASQEQSADRLLKIKAAIIKRYINEENAVKNKEIGARTWQSRRMFLINRYIDAARRLDYINYIESEEAKGKV